jgi:hypothetical protein
MPLLAGISLQAYPCSHLIRTWSANTEKLSALLTPGVCYHRHYWLREFLLDLRLIFNLEDLGTMVYELPHLRDELKTLQKSNLWLHPCEAICLCLHYPGYLVLWFFPTIFN